VSIVIRAFVFCSYNKFLYLKWNRCLRTPVIRLYFVAGIVVLSRTDVNVTAIELKQLYCM
jgi:hypothetical protein